MPSPQVELQRAGAALNGGDARAASRICQKLLTANPRDVEARYLHGRCLAGLGRMRDATAEFRKVLTARRGFFPALVDLGIAAALDGNYEEGRAALEQARAIDSRPAELHFGLGLCLLGFKDSLGAIEAFRAAIERNPHFPDAYSNLGVAYDRLGQLTEARDCFRQALAIYPEHVDAQRNLDAVASRLEEASGGDGALQRAADLESLGSSSEALSVLQAAAQAHPTHADVHDALGMLLHRLSRLPEALDCYERALEIDDHRTQTYLNCGHALESLGALSRAIECFERARTLDPGNVQAVASIASCAFRLCDWELKREMLEILRSSPNGIDELQSFLLLASDIDPSDAAQSLRRRAAATVWPAPPTSPPARIREVSDRLRVAYVSPDFRIHPVGYAIAGVIESHDRNRIATIGISLRPPDGSAIASRLQSAFEEFIDASTLSDRDVVKLMRERGIDIGIDLAGLTAESRTGIFAMRAAPVQVNYLGYPGSMGMDFMDYLVADRLVVPAADEVYYAEKILRLPNSYLPFDDTRRIPAGMTRASAGLPAEGFVFCAFNNGFKITHDMFAVWMSLLREVRGSVLWLRSMGPMTAANLKNAAAAAGIAPDRLIFASFEERIEVHLARLQLADVYLDTLPYNAHTTATEALWAGVPVITCIGKTFAGRVGASLLAACGIPELIRNDLESYQSFALQVARAPALLEGLRDRLRLARTTSPLFDTRRYTRDLEALLMQIGGR